MKQNITLEELSQLSDSQKQNLRKLWTPQKYDLAAAEICKDADEEIYDQIIFVVGKINIYENTSRRSCSITLEDICYSETQPQETDSTEDESEQDGNETEDLEQTFETEPALEYSKPFIFSPEDCLPLLNIGQMINIIYTSYDWNKSLYINISDEKCFLGKYINEWDRFGADFEGVELCDLLWEAVKNIL